MSLFKLEKADKSFSEHSIEERCYLLLFVGFCFCFTAFIVWAFFSGINDFIIFDDAIFYLKESGIVISGILILPFPFLMTVCGIQKLFNYKNEQTFKLMVKVMLYCIPLCLVSTIISGFVIESSLKSKGYSYCYWFTGASFRNSDIWIKNEDFCLQAGSRHTTLVKEYFENKYAKGEEPDLVEFKEMLAVANKKRDERLNRY